MCDKETRVKSHSESKNDLNAQCVWGTLIAGMGFSQAEEFMSTVGVPFMSEPKFRKEEEFVGTVSRPAKNDSSTRCRFDIDKFVDTGGRIDGDMSPKSTN